MKLKNMTPFIISKKKMKYFILYNPKKDVQTHIIKIKKMLMKGIIDLSKLRDIPCSGIGRFNIEKRSIFPKLITHTIECSFYQNVKENICRYRQVYFKIL